MQPGDLGLLGDRNETKMFLNPPGRLEQEYFLAMELSHLIPIESPVLWSLANCAKLPEDTLKEAGCGDERNTRKKLEKLREVGQKLNKINN